MKYCLPAAHNAAPTPNHSVLLELAKCLTDIDLSILSISSRDDQIVLRIEIYFQVMIAKGFIVFMTKLVSC